MSTFAHAKDQDAIEALNALLSFAPVLDEAFIQLVPVLKHFLTSKVDEELGDLFYGMNLMVDLLCELCATVLVNDKSGTPEPVRHSPPYLNFWLETAWKSCLSLTM
jgi:hypothetical protein